MILDDNLVFYSEADMTETLTSQAVPLNMLWKPGRAEPVLIWVKAGNAAGGTSVTVKLQESDTESGSYTDVAGSSVTIPLATLQKDKNVYLRWLPAATAKQWLKLAVAKSGTFTAGVLSAAIVREDDQPYEEGLYIDAGTVVG